MRIAICGGPHTGKTTYAETFGVPVMHTDDTKDLPWSEASAEVAAWFDYDGPWVIEGVAVIRALRKWLQWNPEGKPCDRLVMRMRAWTPRTDGQERMSKGIDTVLREIRQQLIDRGVEIEVIE